jgi:hypothetical protein
MPDVTSTITESTLRCVGCGHNLTGVPLGGTCPECGVEVEQSINALHQTQTSGAAIGALVCGLLAFVTFPPLGVAAILLALKARRDISRGRCSADSATLAIIGGVLGVLATLLTVALVLFLVPWSLW